jgi:hypothetical protein
MDKDLLNPEERHARPPRQCVACAPLVPAAHCSLTIVRGGRFPRAGSGARRSSWSASSAACSSASC